MEEDLKYYEVGVDRQETRHCVIAVSAPNAWEAGNKALSEAGNVDFRAHSAGDPVYSVTDVKCLDGALITEESTGESLPLIHLNGSGRNMLLRHYDRALSKLRAFKEAWIGIEFHKRDYYPLGDAAWERAVAERREMHVRIADLERYLEDHLNHIHNSTERL